MTDQEKDLHPVFGKSSPRFGIIWLVVAVVIPILVYLFAWPAWATWILTLALVVSVVAFWVWAIIAVGNIAAMKGYSKAGFIIFAIFLPIIALVVALVLQPSHSKQTATAQAQMVKCPTCAELVQSEAKKCKHCGSDLTPVA